MRVQVVRLFSSTIDTLNALNPDFPQKISIIIDIMQSTPLMLLDRFPFKISIILYISPIFLKNKHYYRYNAIDTINALRPVSIQNKHYSIY